VNEKERKGMKVNAKSERNESEKNFMKVNTSERK
jgi:hypothetical protein